MNKLMEMCTVKHAVAENFGAKHCTVGITRKLDKTTVLLHGDNFGDKKYKVPSSVAVYYPNGESQMWPDEGYRRMLDADLIVEIDNQIPLMYLILA